MKFSKTNNPKAYQRMVDEQKRKRKIMADNLSEVKERLRKRGRVVKKGNLTAVIEEANAKAPVYRAYNGTQNI